MTCPGAGRGKGRYRVYCAKNPQDAFVAKALLKLEPELYFVWLERDPRDAVVSRHRRDPDRYWTNLVMWRRYQRAANAIGNHPRLVRVRHEQLVLRPEEAQASIVERMPFLTPTRSFRDFHSSSRPSPQAEEALHGVRPLDAGSIGAWRRHKPRLLAQMELHGPLAEDLIRLGYEPDDAWMRELVGVAPANSVSFWPEHVPLRRQLRVELVRRRMIARIAGERALGRRRRAPASPERQNPA